MYTSGVFLINHQLLDTLNVNSRMEDTTQQAQTKEYVTQLNDVETDCELIVSIKYECRSVRLWTVCRRLFFRFVADW